MRSTIMFAIPALLFLMTLITSSHLSYSSSPSALTNSSDNEGELFTTDADIMAYSDSIASILAHALETKINKSGAILEITSKLPEVKSTPFASSISPELHGISEDLDIQKRKVAQDILAADKDFQVIFFLMPNGDVYFVEPYSRQENLTGNNFAFRGYYKGALAIHDTYLDDVVISASSGRPQTNIAVPIYSENNGTLVGVWGGGLNVTSLSKSLQSLNLTSADERVVYVDGQGQKIADSAGDNQALRRNTNESFAGLQSFMNAINGESGTMTEIVNGTVMVVSYHPVNVFYNTWAILFLRPL
jgi:Cache domain